MSQEHIQKCFQSIESLFEKYKDSEYMLQRINNHIVNYLPKTLDNELKNYDKRVTRQNFLSNEQQIFMQVFLSKNKYFYLSNNNYFYEYNGKSYTIVKEDDIIHKLLSSISKDRVLLQWKYKTKVNIIKQIKDRTLFTSIPDTYTIQNILGMLYPSIFNTKAQTKYFLTVIGDNILKKNTNHIFLVSQQMKKMLVELDSIACASIGVSNTTHNFMTKYHENHDYENCRLVKINDTFSNDMWKNIIRNCGLDLLCIAAHYSNRYGDADKFIENNSDEELKNYVYYLKNITQEEIVDVFCSKCINTTSTSANIEWKNLHFVWKQFISGLSLPNMIYSNTLKTILKSKFQFEESTDSFTGITSRYLPIHSDFIKFWEKTIPPLDPPLEKVETKPPLEKVETKPPLEKVETNLDKDLNPPLNPPLQNIETLDLAPPLQKVEDELEIDEICSLFKIWCKQTNETLMTNGNISEENVIKILKHFFPNIEIIEDKYVLNTCCILWDKNKDIFDSFDYIKEQVKNEYKLALMSFDDAYNYYYKYCSLNSHKLIVSKRYFEKYIYFNLSKYVVYDKFIETGWIMNPVA